MHDSRFDAVVAEPFCTVSIGALDWMIVAMQEKIMELPTCGLIFNKDEYIKQRV